MSAPTDVMLLRAVDFERMGRYKVLTCRCTSHEARWHILTRTPPRCGHMLGALDSDVWPHGF